MNRVAAPLDFASKSLGVVRSFTKGPVRKDSMQAPSGLTTGNYWGVWNREVLQDYRAFSPLHQGTCNIAFADGSVRSYRDENNDSLLNNGFTPNSNNPFTSGVIEMKPTEVQSMYAVEAEILD